MTVFFFLIADRLSPSAMSASSRNLAPPWGEIFPRLSQARSPSGPVKFERGLIQRSFARFDFGPAGFGLLAIKRGLIVRNILTPKPTLANGIKSVKIRQAGAFPLTPSKTQV